MSNIIRLKVYVRSCNDEECDHQAVGLKWEEATGQCIESIACPVAVARQLRGHEPRPAYMPDGDPKHILEFQPLLDGEGRPLRCAYPIRKKGEEPYPCGRPTVWLVHELECEGWTRADNSETYGACRIHTQTLSGVKVRNQQKVHTMPRDFQRSRVYKWEWAALPDGTKASLTLEECRDLVERIWAAHGLEGRGPPKVQLVARKKRGSSFSLMKNIELVPSHLNPIVTIHETAHALLLSLDSHGPLFMRLFLELLERYAGETPEPAENLKVASYQELAAVEKLRGFEIAEQAVDSRQAG